MINIYELHFKITLVYRWNSFWQKNSNFITFVKMNLIPNILLSKLFHDIGFGKYTNRLKLRSPYWHITFLHVEQEWATKTHSFHFFSFLLARQIEFLKLIDCACRMWFIIFSIILKYEYICIEIPKVAFLTQCAVHVHFLLLHQHSFSCSCHTFSFFLFFKVSSVFLERPYQHNKCVSKLYFCWGQHYVHTS